MKKALVSAAIFCLVCLAAVPAPAGKLEASGSSNYHFLILTPGHSQTMYFELDNSVLNKSSEFHVFYCLTVGAGTLNMRVGPASSVGEFAGLVYGVGGFLGLQPVGQYAYNAETININAAMPSVGAGIVLTAIALGSGNPDYPIVMSMVASFF